MQHRCCNSHVTSSIPDGELAIEVDTAAWKRFLRLTTQPPRGGHAMTVSVVPQSRLGSKRTIDRFRRICLPKNPKIAVPLTSAVHDFPGLRLCRRCLTLMTLFFSIVPLLCLGASIYHQTGIQEKCHRVRLRPGFPALRREGLGDCVPLWSATFCHAFPGDRFRPCSLSRSRAEGPGQRYRTTAAG
jgi:hypothetical protein